MTRPLPFLACLALVASAHASPLVATGADPASRASVPGAPRFRVRAELVAAQRVGEPAVGTRFHLDARLLSKATGAALCPTPGTIFSDGFDLP